MAMTALWLKIDEDHVVQTLREAAEKLDGSDGEVMLDVSSLRRIDSGALRAMEEFVGLARDKGVKVVLRSVNVDVYKVFKLTKLTSRFTFVA
jgi:anti-anti-sigma regulatory factor